MIQLTQTAGMTDGCFITFEGGEGSGKSTQARLLADRLRTSDRRIVLTREPGGSPFAERLRSLILDPSTPPHGPLTETLLFYAARADHVIHTIRPALAQGRWVICDRFSDSTRVYQGVAGDVALPHIEALEAIVVGATTPNLTIIMDIDPEVGLARADARRTGIATQVAGARGKLRRGAGGDAYESRDIGYHQRLRAGFLGVASREPSRCVVIDASRSEAEIASDVLSAVTSRLLQGAG